jgi:hypothetical protein
MSSLPNGLTFQVILTPPTGGNVSALRQQIQAGLGNIQANVQLNNAATANKQLNAISASTKKSTKDTKNFGDAIGIAGRNFAAYTSAVAILGRISIAISRATRDAIKFEREFVKLAQVFDTNVKNLEGLSNKISELSQQYGLSANVIAKTSVVLAQSGLTARETQIALNSLAKTTLASTFENIGQTAEGAIAIIAQFEEGVGSLESQLGAINAVSKKFAVESSDIIEAVRRGGGAFKAANGTFTEFISLFTAVRSTTRESAETISTGFRTIFARLQRPKVIDYFKELNIQLEDGQGNFVGAFEAVKRLSEGLDRAGIKAGQIKFAEVVEQLGGIRQVSRVIPLLGQFKKAEEARQVALAGGVSLDKDVAKAQETTAQAIERTRQNFAALIREISQTQSFKQIVKIALSMANAFLEIARTLKPLIPLIAVLGSIKLGGLFSTAVKTGFTTPGLGTKRPFAKGGTVLGFNRGGSVPGTGNGDTVPAMLEPGEFVIRKSAVQAFGEGRLADINRYASGGSVKDYSVGAKYTVPPKYTYDKDAGSRFVKKGSKDKPRTSFNESDTFSFQEDVQGIRVTDADFVNNPKLEEQYKNQGPLKRGRAFEQIIAKRKKVQLARKSSGDAASSSRLDGISPRGVPVEIKSTSESQAGLISSKIIGGALEPRSENVDKKLEKKLNASRLTNQGNNIDFGKIILYEDQTGALGRKKTPTKKLLPVKRALGGSISGAGTDTVPALLTPGEFVINKKSAEAFGYGGLAKINKYAKGGPVGVKPSTISKIGAKRTISLSDKTDRITASYPNDASGGGEVTADLVKNSTSGKLYSVQSSRATKGLGPKLYDTVMESATRKGGSLISDRSRVSPSAYNVWSYYFNKRSDVSKKPLKSADWYFGDKYFDTQAFASEDPKTWPPTSDPAWTLQSGYSKKPSIIKDLKQTKRTGFALGGSVGTDTVPALLTPGEFVVNKQSAQAFGYGGLAKINKYAKGGVVGVQKFADGGEVGGSGGFGGFDFITSASTEFGILLFALKQISDSFKKFQDGLSKSSSGFKKLIGADKKSIAVRQKLFESGLMLDINLREGAEKIDAFQTRIVDASKAAEVLQKEFEFIGSERFGEKGTSRRAQFVGEISGQEQVSFAGLSGPKLEKLDSKTKELLRSYSDNAEVMRAATALQQKFGQKVGNQIKATTASNAAIKTYLSQVKNSAEAIKKQNNAVNTLTDVHTQLVQNQRALSESSRKRQKQLDAQTEASKGFLSVKGATRGVKKGLTSVASKIDPLVATAAIAGSLDAILNQIIGSFSNLAESAVQNGDVQEAALAARQESEAKLNKTIILGATATGAAIGSIVPVVGTAIGAGVGAIAGTLATYGSSLKTSLYDSAISFVNMTGFFGQMETYSEESAKNEKKRVEQAKSTNFQKALDGIGVKFRNASRDLDPKTNFAGFASEANKLAEATKAQKDAALKLSKDSPDREKIIAQADQQVKDAFDQLEEAANAQGISLQKVAQDYPELVEAFKGTLPPDELESMWKQRTQVNQAAIAAIAAENAAKQRSISIFLAQLSIQVRLNASLEAFDAALSRQKDSLANLDFAISGSVGKKEIGSNLTDFDSSGTAKFAEGLREVSRLGPDFANQANQIQGVLQEFAGFSQSLAGGDLTQVSGDISRRLSGILSGPQIEKIRKEILDFEGKNDPAAVKALEKKLIEDAIGPFAQTLERGRQQINESLDNYSQLLEKRNTIEKRIYDRRVDSLKLEQDIQNKISEIRGDDPSLFKAGADRTARGRNALSGTGLGGRLTGNAANDVSLVAGELATNRNAQKLLQQNINSGRLDLAQQKSARSALQDLGLEADKLETSMQLLSDTTQETAILQKQLDESREGRKQKGELATELAFGTKESRFNFQQTLGLTKLAVQSGSAEVIPEEKRGDVLSLLKRFEKLPVFGGRTGAEVIKNLTGNFLRNQGFKESQIDEVLADMVPTEEKILKQIGANLTVDQIRNNLLGRILKKLDVDVLASAPKSTGGPIYASTGKLVNYQPKGTDTVPAMLTPGEFVIKKSSVDKYGAGMLAAINAGNYATGGIITPFYRSDGGGGFSSDYPEGSVGYEIDRKRYDKKLQEKQIEKQRKKNEQFSQPSSPGFDEGKRQQQTLANQQAAKANAQASYQKEVEDFQRETGQKKPVARENEKTSEYIERSRPYYKAFQEWKNEQKSGDTIGYRRTKTTNDINEMENRQNEKAAEVKTTDQKKSSEDQQSALDFALGKGPKPYYAMSAKEKAELYKKKMAETVTDSPNNAVRPADPEATSTDIFRTILEQAFGINETPEQKRQQADADSKAAEPISYGPNKGGVAADPEATARRRAEADKQEKEELMAEQRRADQARLEAEQKAKQEKEEKIRARRAEIKAFKEQKSKESLAQLTSETYPVTQQGVYDLAPASPASNLAEFLKSALGQDSSSWIKEYQKRGIKTAKITGDQLSQFKESEANLILNGQPLAYDLTLGGAFTKNPKLSVLSQDEKLFFLWAKANGAKGWVSDVANTENKSHFEKWQDELRAELPFPSNYKESTQVPLGNFNDGGQVGGVPGVDANPAMLTRGEYVINKKSAEAIGINNLNRLNSARGYNKGGRVGYYADGGSVGGLGNSSESYTMFSNSVDKLVGNNGFAMFKQSVDQFNSIPKELTLTVAPTQVTVTLNGAELLSRMTPMIKSQIFEGITSEINKLKEDLKSGNIV